MEQLLNYLRTQNVGVLAVEMLDGSPHGATVHFAHVDNPFVLYFETNKHYRKAEPLTQKKNTRATFVVGTDEKTMKTLQLDGVVELIQPDELPLYEKIYIGKFPHKKEKLNDQLILRFKFTPTWWRYSDFSAPGGKIILTSTDK